MEVSGLQVSRLVDSVSVYGAVCYIRTVLRIVDRVV